MSMSSSTSSSRYYVPALGGIYAKLDPFMLPLLRVAQHPGAQRGLARPRASTAAAD